MITCLLVAKYDPAEGELADTQHGIVPRKTRFYKASRKGQAQKHESRHRNVLNDNIQNRFGRGRGEAGTSFHPCRSVEH